MLMKINQQMIYMAFATFFMLVLAVAPAVVFDFIPDYRSSTVVLTGAFFLVWHRRGLLSFPTIFFVIIFFPALSPFYAWDLRGVSYFSLAAQHLQRDIDLVDQLTWSFAVAAITYSATVFLRPGRAQRSAPKPLFYINKRGAFVLGVMVCVSAYVTDPGPTIWTNSYTDVLTGRFEASEDKIFLTLIMGGAWVSLFLFARHHKAIFWAATTISAVWLFLHVRRVEVFGMALVLFIWMRSTLPQKRVVTFLGLFILLQFLMGEIRSISIFAAFSGESWNTNGSVGFLDKAALPGGASNVFLAGLHLVNVKVNGLLLAGEMYTMIEWLKALVPGSILSIFGILPAQTEHTIVFENLGLQYVGGMPLLSVYFLNGGYVLTAIFGVLHGIFSNALERISSSSFSPNSRRGGNFAMFFLMVLLFYQFRYHWYNPQAPIRALELSLIVYWVSRLFFKYQKTHRLNRQTSHL